MYISVIIYQEEVNVSKNSDEWIREGGGDVTSMSTMWGHAPLDKGVTGPNNYLTY